MYKPTVSLPKLPSQPTSRHRKVKSDLPNTSRAHRKAMRQLKKTCKELDKLNAQFVLKVK